MYTAVMNRMMSRNQEDDITKELDRQAAEDEKARAEKRLEEATAASITAGQERTRQGAARTGAYLTAQEAAAQAHRAAVVKAFDDIANNRKRVDIAASELEAHKPLWSAQTKEAEAHTGLFGAQTTGENVKTQGERDKQARAVVDDNMKHDNQGMAFAIAQATRGQPFTADETDELERKFQRYGQDKFFKLPRNDDGSWKYDPKMVAQQYPIFDSRGQPTTKLANDLRTSNKPYSTYYQELADADRLLKDPSSTPEERRMAGMRLVKSSAPSMEQVGTDIMSRLVAADNLPAAMNFMKDYQTKWGEGKGAQGALSKPTGKQQSEMEDRLALVQSMNENIRHFQLLKARGWFPTGVLRQPLLNVLQETGLANPYVEAFRNELNTQISQYMNLMHGRRFMTEEMKFIKHAMPSEEDATNVFEQVAVSMRQHMINDIRSRAGVLQMWGVRIPEGIDPILPADILAGGGNLPDIETSTGLIPAEKSKDYVIGLQNMTEALRRSGQDIGGLGAFRKVNPTVGEVPGAPGQLGESTLGPPSEMEQRANADVAAEVERLKKLSPEQLQQELDSMSGEVWNAGGQPGATSHSPKTP
jgi:hypothetical protein